MSDDDHKKESSVDTFQINWMSKFMQMTQDLERTAYDKGFAAGWAAATKKTSEDR